MATSEFGKAFREARASGDKTFTFNGKKYTTDLAPAEQKSIGSKAKMGEYVPRDADTRKGEIMTSKNAVPRDNYVRSGQKSMDTETEPSEIMANRYRDTGMSKMAGQSNLENDEKMGGVMGGYKRGGKVMPAKYMSFSKTGKPAGMKSVTKMASGGSASSRADGIATKGKTRGKMC
jgi:hypothetical protein